MYQDRTNILLIHSDQHRFDCLGANGHPFLQTPNLNSLAAQGANFTHAFTPSPICSPARGSQLTGTWPATHGCMSIPGTEVYRPGDPSLPTYSAILMDNGYNLGYVGKYHQELPGLPTDFGFSEYAGFDEYPEWRMKRGKKQKPRKNGWFGELDSEAAPEDTLLAWGAENTIRMIREYSSQKNPFMIRWDPVEPHLPNILPEPYYSMYPPESVPPWPSFFDELSGKPYIQAQQKRSWKVDGWEWEKWQPIVSRYLGEISLLDAQIGRVLQVLDELNLRENTVVIYTTDHGDMCGGHGMMDKHFIMYDDVVRVPLIIRYPQKIPAGRIVDDFVIHEIDIASTIVNAAGLDAPDSFRGTDLITGINRPGSILRDDVFAQWHGGQFSSYTQRMVRNREWKYVWNAAAEDELYNLSEDPPEINNLASARSCREIISKLRRRLVEWMEDTDDIMLNPWTREQLELNLTR